MSGISHEELQAYEYSASAQPITDQCRVIAKLCAEIRRLRAKNKELKMKVALLTSDKRDLIEEIDGPVTESW